MKTTTLAALALSAFAFATAASACPFMSKTKDKTAEAPILQPQAPSGS